MVMLHLPPSTSLESTVVVLLQLLFSQGPMRGEGVWGGGVGGGCSGLKYEIAWSCQGGIVRGKCLSCWIHSFEAW